MPELHTKASLLSALKDAATRGPTKEELRRQRVSFVMGMIGDGDAVSRERVAEIIDEQEDGKRTQHA
jgi:hypothetical protein